jgi:hypothetical protein
MIYEMTLYMHACKASEDENEATWEDLESLQWRIQNMLIQLSS